MEEQEALALFWKHNHLDSDRVGQYLDPAYDLRLAKLPETLGQWLDGMEEGDRPLFLELLSRFTYLTPVECRRRYDQLLVLLQQRLGRENAEFEDVLFVTVESSGRRSGSDNIRADLHRDNLFTLRKSQILAAQSKLEPEEAEEYNVVVFLDDVIGSGETLWSTMQEFCQRFQLGKAPGPRLFYASIAPRAKGAARLAKSCQKEGIQAEPLWEDSWITAPAFPKDSEEFRRMEKYEDMVGNYLMDGERSFFMGFEKNRMLLSLYYNTPNNTLSTFWRKTPDWEAPPFYRDGNQP